MARRKRRTTRRTASGRFAKRARRVRINPPNRKRRRRHHVSAYRRKGGRVRSYTQNPSRRRRHRRYSRNPRFGIGFIVEGLKGGAGVVVGQVATRKLAGLATKYIPGMSTGTIGYVGSGLAGAIVTALIAPRVAGRWAQPITFGAFAEAINRGLAQTPVAPFLSDSKPAINFRRNAGLAALAPGSMGAYPLAGGLGAYPDGIPDGAVM